MIDAKVLKSLLVEVHHAIAESATTTVDALGDPSARQSVTYPPNEEFTLAEVEALKGLRLSDAARTGLRKVIADAAAYPFFHFFSLLDGVVDPPLILNGEQMFDGVWTGVAIRPKSGEHEEMLHDAFYDTYWDSRGRRTTGDGQD
jgi:hypothetical protein